jgi:hypothetical protein
MCILLIAKLYPSSPSVGTLLDVGVPRISRLAMEGKVTFDFDREGITASAMCWKEELCSGMQKANTATNFLRQAERQRWPMS